MRPAPDDGREWWTTSQVAAYLGLRIGTVSSYRHRGQMPPPTVIAGRTPLWWADTIRQWRPRGSDDDNQPGGSGEV